MTYDQRVQAVSPLTAPRDAVRPQAFLIRIGGVIRTS